MDDYKAERRAPPDENMRAELVALVLKYRAFAGREAPADPRFQVPTVIEYNGLSQFILDAMTVEILFPDLDTAGSLEARIAAAGRAVGIMCADVLPCACPRCMSPLLQRFGETMAEGVRDFLRSDPLHTTKGNA